MSNEQSIRDELATLLNDTDPEGGIDLDDEFSDKQFWYPQVDAILASPVIRRIQSEALREASDLMLDPEEGLPFDDDEDRAIPSAWLLEQSARIERGETA